MERFGEAVLQLLDQVMRTLAGLPWPVGLLVLLLPTLLAALSGIVSAFAGALLLNAAALTALAVSHSTPGAIQFAVAAFLGALLLALWGFHERAAKRRLSGLLGELEALRRDVRSVETVAQRLDQLIATTPPTAGSHAQRSAVETATPGEAAATLHPDGAGEPEAVQAERSEDAAQTRVLRGLLIELLEGRRALPTTSATAVPEPTVPVDRVPEQTVPADRTPVSNQETAPGPLAPA